MWRGEWGEWGGVFFGYGKWRILKKIWGAGVVLDDATYEELEAAG